MNCYQVLFLTVIVPGYWFTNTLPLNRSHIRLLSDWDFDYFELFQKFHSNKGTVAVDVNEILTRDDFSVIRNICCENGLGLTPSQIVQAFELYDRLLAKEPQRVVELFCELLTRQHIPFPAEFLTSGLWNCVESYLKENYSILINSSGIEIDASNLKISLESALLVLLNLAPFYSEIDLKNFSLNSSETYIIQHILAFDLKGVHLENCLFANSLDFSFVELDSFSCNNCSNVEEMLRGMNTLISLNISNCQVTSQVTDWIKQNEMLEYFCFSNNNVTSTISFDFLFDFKNLSEVNLSNCSLNNFFLLLDQIDFQLPWSVLNLSKSEMSEKDFELLCNNLSKLPNLTSLDISDNLCDVFLLTENIDQLRFLQELVIGNYEGDLSDLLDKIIELGTPVRIISSNMQYPTKATHLFYLTDVTLSEIEDFSCKTQGNFIVRSLGLNSLEILPDEFLSKFSTVTELTLALTDENMEYFRRILRTNPVREVTLTVYDNELELPLDTFNTSSIEKLVINGDICAEGKFFTQLSTHSFWNSLVEFDCSGISPKELLAVLKRLKMASLSVLSFTIQNSYPVTNVSRVTNKVVQVADEWIIEMYHIFNQLHLYSKLSEIRIGIKNMNYKSLDNQSTLSKDDIIKYNLVTRINNYINRFPHLKTLSYGNDEYQVIEVKDDSNSKIRKLVSKE